MRHSVAFKCTNDAKKNDPKVYFHMEPGENLNPLRKSIAFLLLDDFECDCVR